MKYAMILALLLASCGGGGSTDPVDTVEFTAVAVVVNGVPHYPDGTEPLVLTSDGSFGIRSYVEGPITRVTVQQGSSVVTYSAFIPYTFSWESHDDWQPGLLLVKAWAVDGRPFIGVFNYQPGVAESFALRLTSLWL